ncbi:MAG: pyridoxamine 5'-phosphate oxidase family protein [Anaerolineae bacterium]|nr:pyridoxamine 5'-phosphate oxidase family protein [Anaerolineae bacterium]
MAEMPQEIVDLINSVPLCYLATATRSGIPDVAPVATAVARDAGTILVAVTAQGKSATNIRENARAALVVHSTPPSGRQASLASISQVRGAQIKGRAVVVASGDHHEQARKRTVESLGPEARDTFEATIVLQVEEIHSLVPQAGR